MSMDLNDFTEQVSIDLKNREFMEKVGKYAVGAGMATLMTPTLSTAGNYGQRCNLKNNGWGNGDQSAPGRSLHRNRAENDERRRVHRKHSVAKPN